MTIQDSVNLDELRRLAEQATPGPWHGTTIGTRSQADEEEGDR